MALTFRQVAVAAIVAFVGWGYATYWIPVLQYLGYAFVAGAILTPALIGLLALLSIRAPSDRVAKARRRHAFFIEPKSWEEETEWLSNMAETRKAALYPSSFAVSASVDELLDWILRDFVSSWYNNISMSPAFRNRIDVAVRQAMNTLRARIESQDFVEALILRVTPLITTHLKTFNEAELAVRGKNLNRNVTETEELDLSIAAKYNDGILHPAASLSFSDTKLVQQEYLKKLCTRLMPQLVSETLLQSRAVAVLVREIVACAVLSPIIQMLCDPDTWNQVVESYGKSALQDRKHVRKLRAALDEHASPKKKPHSTVGFPKLTPQDDERKFERFVRAIRRCNNLSEARRCRSEVASQLARESMLQNQDMTFIRRLETGKRILDQKISMLGAAGGSVPSRAAKTSQQPAAKSRMAKATLKEVLHDASGLSYFMEYMDRHRRMSLVQFWIVVDGFRNPLEDDATEASDSLGAPLKWTPSDRQDIAQISEAYLTKPEIKVPPYAQQDVQEFLKAGKDATAAQYSTARSTVLKAQTAIYEEMQERYYPKFRNSDMFYKLLTSEDASSKQTGMISSKAPKRPSLAAIHETAPNSDFLFPPRTRSVDLDRSELKRNALSSGNLQAEAQALDDDFLAPRPRRSLDVDTSGPLFRDDVAPDTESRPLFGNESDTGHAAEGGANEEQIEAMEAALNTIISDPQDDDIKDSVSDGESSALTGSEIFKERTSGEFRRIGSVASTESSKATERPNLASLGLVNTSSRIGVFTDNDLFNDEQKFLEDEHVDSDHEPEKDDDDEIHEAAPGDLGLAEAISVLSVDIDRLAAQDAIVDTLSRKAELTNNVAELRILGKSKASIQKELRQKELQRQQYIVQESDNSLYGRATVSIKSIMVGKDEDGLEFALYVIEVQRTAGDAMPAAVWAVARRYSEFHDLHARLRPHYAAVRALEFPRRRLVMKLQRDFLDKRRAALEQYLRELLLLPAVCRSRDLRAFLSQRPIATHGGDSRPGQEADLVSRIYNSVTDGMDEFLGNIPVLDQLSTAGQNLISAATSQYQIAFHATAEHAGPASPASAADVREARAAQAELDAFENHALEPFIKPISDLFLETFELNRSQNWLRGRAVVVVLHQLLGGTVERKVRDGVKDVTSDEHLLQYIDLVKGIMWPGGTLQRERTPRTPPQRKASRREAGALLALLLPELAGGVVGRANAAAAARRLGAALNNERLNTHLVFGILDEVVNILFPKEH